MQTRPPLPPALLMACCAAGASCVTCGARTPLDVAPHLDASADTSPPVAPYVDASADTSPPASDAGRLHSSCTSALLAGAPAPLEAYCSTRARLAPAAGPTSPRVAWSVALAGSGVVVPYDLVVDANGRAYVAYSADPSTQDADTVEAVNADGTVAWVHDFRGQVPQHLFLAPDGRLRLVLSFPTPTLVVMASSGDLAESHPVPGNANIWGWPSGATEVCTRQPTWEVQSRS